MSLYEELQNRGIIKQVTHPQLAEALTREKFTLYCGFDPTADSLHVGSLLPLMTLRRFQKAGHRIIAVVGGGTGMIGDPSGKGTERALLSEEEMQRNLDGIQKAIARILDFQGSNPALVLNNADWLRKLSFIDFLREVGKHFTVNHMIAKESVRARLEDREHGISFTEFSYMLLQAYDFYYLEKNYQCRLQIGGSDQWGNITAGIELVRRTQSKEVFGLTHPLVMKADGTKFGKTEQGNIWLDPEKTSPYQFYQFFLQTTDADVITFLKYFTELSLPEIKKLEKLLQEEPEKRAAQNALAHAMTCMVHGSHELEQAEKISQSLFGTEIRNLSPQALLSALSGAPQTQKPLVTFQSVALVDLLVETHLCSSKSIARKEINSGGIYVNNERVSDPTALLSAQHLIHDHYIVLRKGKKNYHLILFK